MDQKTITDLEMQLDAATSGSMVELVSYLIFGAVMTSSKAFKSAEIRIDPKTSRVFAAVELRWWARLKRLEPFREFWLRRAEERSRQYVPEGWRLLVYFKGV